MSKILGLDLGTNSIGWALVDDTSNKILGMGSRIFPEGVDNLGDGSREISKNASRTANRSIRRQFFRRKLRKRLLLRELAAHNFCPISYEDVKIWTDDSVFSSTLFREWARMNPYELRARALTEEITLHEIGRILYHMIQRRGFLSNSRSAGDDDGVIYEGKAAEGKTGILETRENLKNKTLGKYLYELYPNEHEPFKGGKERIRNRYTTRKMYVDEFEAIWTAQKQYHEELTDQLKTKLGGRKNDGYAEDGILFYQRPLRSQKHLIGICSFEPKKPKSPISTIPFEEFRIHQWVNTVECNGSTLSTQERDILVNELLSKKKPKFSALRKKLKKVDSEFQFNYKDDDKIVGSDTISTLSSNKFFGNKWFNLSKKDQEDIWHVLFFFDDKKKLYDYAIKHWGFTETQADQISKFNLTDGYANLSRKAINNILPFLKQGYQYDIAVALGGVKNALGERWSDLNDDELELIDTNVPAIVRSNLKGGYINHLKEFMANHFDLEPKSLKKLYHHSSHIENSTLLDKLPLGKAADQEIQSIRNPVVIAALFEIRKLVNELIEGHGKLDVIKVEMARDLKVSKSKRNEIRREQKRLERENDRIKSELDYIGQRPTHENILKFKLWEECNKTCPYTGQQINVKQLFSGEVQIEHIIPWSKSLNDSFMNKTLCFADENRSKGDLTPFEFYSKQGEAKWEQIKEQALTCFKNKEHYPNAYGKFKQFVKTKYDDDFVSRQLNDTRYISKEAKNYLNKICEKVQVSPGQATSNLRHHWGLNTILDDEAIKTRDDHRHHAIDALVMACSTPAHLQELSRWNRYDRHYNHKDFPFPWASFRQDAETAVNKILVSHKQVDNVLTRRTNRTKKNGKVYTNTGIAARGQLHKETVFGKRKAPHSDTAYHVRKPIESLTTKKHIEKVVDPTVRTLLVKRINELGGFINDKTIPKGAFLDMDEHGMPQPQIFLPNKNGEPVPVRKVRMKENLGSAEQLKETNQWVNPRSNHHVLIYKTANGELKEDVVTFWTAVERKIQGLPIVQLPPENQDGAIVTTLKINDMFYLSNDNDIINWDNIDYHSISKNIYRVQKITAGTYTFTHHIVSSLKHPVTKKHIQVDSYKFDPNIEQFPLVIRKACSSFNGVKVNITPTGKIQKC